jgi:pimeloyl-ACP methyl ester carboxylesterase
MAKWPSVPLTRDLPSEYGVTRVYEAGPTEAPPLLLLHGGRATAASWYAVVGPLADSRRVLAAEPDRRRRHSRHHGRPLRTAEDLVG